MCPSCQSNHLLYSCPSFKDKSPRERYQFIKQTALCLNCLKPSHVTRNCPSQTRCRQCNYNYHTLLHFSSGKKSNTCVNFQRQSSPQIPTRMIEEGSATPSTSHQEGTQHCNHVATYETTVLLSTAKVEVLNDWGRVQSARCLLDSGSQANFITETCLKRLSLRRSKSTASVIGLGEQSSRVLGQVSCTIRPAISKTPELKVDLLVVPSICSNMPFSQFLKNSWTQIRNLELADSAFNMPSEIDLLLGADVFASALREGRVEGKPGHPIAINTVFGWIVMGKIRFSESPYHSLFVAHEPTLDNTLKKFWELEEIPPNSHNTPISHVECEAEKIFVESTTRDSSGRYTVDLPFKSKVPTFHPGTRSCALRRFLSLERRLISDPETYRDYRTFMDDYLETGHMTLAQEPISPHATYYIPHHCVKKPDSSTTKLRVVFDASFKSTSDSYSLNDCLYSGPKLQKDIVDILLRLRLHAVAFTADIKQMYRQIWVNPSHRNYQRILWRPSPDETIQDYLLNTVTFGVTSRPFLALRTLQQLAEDEKGRFPSAASVLQRDLFVDDCVSSCESIEEALLVQSQLIEMCRGGGFDLRKWSSNNGSMLSHLPESMCNSHLSSLDFDSDDMSSIKILGLQWHPFLDYFSYKVNSIDRPCTKRNVLSELARIYDPLGLLAPLTFFAKYLIQHLWTLGLDWDDAPPDDVLQKWLSFSSELHLLSTLEIPRRILSDNHKDCSLHGFCDSSEKGFAAVLYFRVVNFDNTVSCNLVCAKSKVAPLKKISIPRLELCGAVLLADLITLVQTAYINKLDSMKIFAWSDSMVALNWLKAPSYRWKTFVYNRVSHIQDRVPPSSWRYVPSEINPADHASRGLLPSDLLDCSQWWAGPSWLADLEENWPKNSLSSPSSTVITEERRVVLVTTEDTTLPHLLDSILEKFSSLSRIKKIICYLHRFLYNCRLPTNERSLRHFTSADYHTSLLILVRHVQQSVFSQEILKIKNNEVLSKSFRKLSPFMDEDNILRVGGRLAHANLSFDKIHPILLPNKHRLTHLIIEDVHIKNLHPGMQTLQYLLTQQFWILSPKRAIRFVISKCIRCFRIRPKALEPLMGNLPAYRLGAVKPFETTGVDFAGPYYITMLKTRGSKTMKAYICLFVCMATKALLLEVASDLTSDTFLAALRRFIGRRGRCNHIISDQGTNFVGANRELQKCMEDATTREAIRWSFNPPSASHFGGLWEANVKSVKTHFSRVIGDQILTYEEFNTVLIQIESILNSRPLCPLSSDPNDLQVLIPGHFLILEPLNAAPCPDYSEVPLNRLSRWQLLQRMIGDFWRRWSTEYLNTLQQRSKWTKKSPNVEVDTLVLIKDDQSPPLRWRLARVVELHPGVDGISRVVTVKTLHGLMQRPIVKLCPLPIQ